MNGSDPIRAFFSLPRALWDEVRITGVSMLLLCLIGYVMAALRPEAVEPVMRIFTQAAAEAGIYQVEGGVLMTTILSNNLFSMLMMIAVGLIPFAHLSALPLGVNALLIGGLAAFYARSGLGMAAYFAGILPHGVAELSALVLSCAAGLYLCRATTYAVLGKVDRRTVSRTLGTGLRAYTHWIVPLLTFAAFVEAFVTPLIFGIFYQG